MSKYDVNILKLFIIPFYFKWFRHEVVYYGSVPCLKLSCVRGMHGKP